MSKNFTLKSCTSCMLPETYETFDFDENGTCNVCNNHKNQKSKIKFKLNILNNKFMIYPKIHLKTLK